MRRLIGLTGGIVALLLSATPGAYAKAVPFDAAYQIDEQGFVTSVDYTEDTGMVGFCAKDACWGVRVIAGTSSVGAGTSRATVTLRGSICVLDTTSDCSVNGMAFTGIRFTESVVDVPEAHADAVPVFVSLCRWQGTAPVQCLAPLPVGDLQFHDTGDLTDLLPSQVGMSS